MEAAHGRRISRRLRGFPQKLFYKKVVRIIKKLNIFCFLILCFFTFASCDLKEKYDTVEVKVHNSCTWPITVYFKNDSTSKSVEVGKGYTQSIELDTETDYTISLTSPLDVTTKSWSKKYNFSDEYNNGTVTISWNSSTWHYELSTSADKKD